MQVSLKQSELTAAVRQYIAKQGINLVGKDVDVKFSATRGDAGIMATIDIEDSDLPELTPNVRPELRVIAAPAGPLTPIVSTAAANLGEAQSPFVASSDEPELVTTTTADIGGDDASTKKSSLFA